MEVEAVDIVVHGVKAIEARPGAHEAEQPAAVEHLAGLGGRAVEIERGRGDDRPRLEERAPLRAVGEAGAGQVLPARRIEGPEVARVRSAQRLHARARDAAHLARQARHLDARVHEEPRARTRPGQVEETAGEAAHHAGPRKEGKRGGERGVDGARPHDASRLPDLVARRRGADRGQLHRSVIILHPHRMGERVGRNRIGPALRVPLVAVATLEKRGADHLARYLAGSWSNFTLQATAQK